MMKAVHLRIAVVLAIGVAAPPVALVEGGQSPRIGTPIATLEVRDHLVLVAASASGVRYSVATSDGQLLGTDFSANELEANFPTVFKHIRSSIARSTEPGEFIWAGM